MKGIPIMNTKKIATLLGTVTATVCLISAMGQAAQAGVLHNGWNYALDSTNDVPLEYGNSDYEIYGMAIKENAGKVYVAFNGNFPLEGRSIYEWGDLFFNFSDLPFIQASQNGNLYAVNFSNDDDTPNGVYGNVNPTKLTKDLEIVYTYEDIGVGTDGRLNLGDLSSTDSYFAPQDNYIAYGFDPAEADWLGNITLFDDENEVQNTLISQLELDLDFFVQGTDQTQGSETFGFSFNRDLLPEGTYIAHVFENCGNDGVAIKTPEPSTMVGLFGLGLTVLGSQISKRRKGNGVSQ